MITLVSSPKQHLPKDMQHSVGMNHVAQYKTMHQKTTFCSQATEIVSWLQTLVSEMKCSYALSHLYSLTSAEGPENWP